MASPVARRCSSSLKHFIRSSLPQIKAVLASSAASSLVQKPQLSAFPSFSAGVAALSCKPSGFSPSSFLPSTAAAAASGEGLSSRLRGGCICSATSAVGQYQNGGIPAAFAPAPASYLSRSPGLSQREGVSLVEGSSVSLSRSSESSPSPALWLPRNCLTAGAFPSSTSSPPFPAAAPVDLTGEETSDTSSSSTVSVSAVAASEDEDDPIIRSRTDKQSSAQSPAEDLVPPDRVNLVQGVEKEAEREEEEEEPSGGQGPFKEFGGPVGPEPTRFGDWEKAGRCYDF